MKCLFVGFATVDYIKGKQYPGGAAGALSLNASTLGIESHLLTVLSDDKNGRWYKQILKKNSVQFLYSFLHASSIPTCHIPIDIEHLSTQRIWKDNGSLPYFPKINPPKAYIQSFDLIFIVNSPLSLLQKIYPLIHNRNIIYIPGPQIIKHPEYLYIPLFDKAKLLFSNEEEWAIIKETQPMSKEIQAVIITKGKHGGEILRHSEASLFFKAPNVSSVVDVTGAGDNFALHFSLSYDQDKNIERAIEEGKYAAAAIIGKDGNISSKVIL